MSRWVLVVGAFGVALAPGRAAEPKPLWEIGTVPDAKGASDVPWVGFSPDGRTLVAQVEWSTGAALKGHLAAWDVGTRKEKFRVDLGAGVAPRFGLNTVTGTGPGTALLVRNRAYEVRLSDGKCATAKPGTGPSWSRDVPVGGVNTPTGSSLWLIGREGPRGWEYRFAEGTMPAVDTDPNVPEPEEDWHVLEFEPENRTRFDAAVALSPNGKRIAVGVREFRADASFGLSLHILTADDGPKLREVETVPSGHPGNARISAIAFGPDGKTLATGGGDGSVCLWDLLNIGKDWKPRATIPAGRFTVSGLAFSPDGKLLAAGTTDLGQARKTGTDNLYLIDVATGKAVAAHRLHDALSAVTFSSDGKTLVTAHNRGRIQGWDVVELLKAK